LNAEEKVCRSARAKERKSRMGSADEESTFPTSSHDSDLTVS
jgi:hypothetical protein